MPMLASPEEHHELMNVNGAVHVLHRRGHHDTHKEILGRRNST